MSSLKFCGSSYASDCTEIKVCVCARVCLYTRAHTYAHMCVVYEVIADCSTFNMGITSRKISVPYFWYLFFGQLNSLVLSNISFLQKREIKVCVSC